MISTLKKITESLPDILNGNWKTFYVDYENPIMCRATKQHGRYKVCLHKFIPGADDNVIIHNHPWPGVFLITKGHYEMYMSSEEGENAIGPIVMGPGSYYELSHHDTWHSVRALTEVFTIGIQGPQFDVDWEFEVESDENPFRELTEKEKQGLFNHFKKKKTLELIHESLSIFEGESVIYAQEL